MKSFPFSQGGNSLPRLYLNLLHLPHLSPLQIASVLYLFGKQTQEALWQACLLREDVGLVIQALS